MGGILTEEWAAFLVNHELTSALSQTKEYKLIAWRIAGGRGVLGHSWIATWFSLPAG